MSIQDNDGADERPARHDNQRAGRPRKGHGTDDHGDDDDSQTRFFGSASRGRGAAPADDDDTAGPDDDYFNRAEFNRSQFGPASRLPQEPRSGGGYGRQQQGGGYGRQQGGGGHGRQQGGGYDRQRPAQGYDRPAPRRDDLPRDDRPQRTFRSRGDRPQGDRGGYRDRPHGDRPQGDRGGYRDRPHGDRPQGDRGGYRDRPQGDRPQGDRGNFRGPSQAERDAFRERPPQGGGQRDRLQGGGQRDRLQGGGQRDRLQGGGQRDRLQGGGQRDRMQGGGQRDRMQGDRPYGRRDDRQGGGQRDRLQGDRPYGRRDDRQGGPQRRDGAAGRDPRHGGAGRNDRRPPREEFTDGRHRFDPNRRPQTEAAPAVGSDPVLATRKQAQPKRIPGTTLVKALVSYQYASRSLALKSIHEGRVTLNDVATTQPNAYVKLDRDLVMIDGKVLQRKTVKPIVVVFNKPTGLIGSREEYRKTLYSFLSNKRGWHIPNGVLDKGMSGIVLVTNDPQHKDEARSILVDLTRDVLVKVHRQVKKTEITKMQKLLRERWAPEADDVSVSLHQKNTRNCWLKVSFRHGTLHDIYAVLRAVKLEPLRAVRSRIGPFTVDTLAVGAWYRLSDEEIVALEELARQKPKEDNVSLQSIWQQVAAKIFRTGTPAETGVETTATGGAEA